MPRILFNDVVKLLLVAAMAIFLPLILAGEAVALVFDGQVVGNDVGTAADVLGWLFAAAFLALFLMMIIEKDRQFRAQRKVSTASRPSH